MGFILYLLQHILLILILSLSTQSRDCAMRLRCIEIDAEEGITYYNSRETNEDEGGGGMPYRLSFPFDPSSKLRKFPIECYAKLGIDQAGIDNVIMRMLRRHEVMAQRYNMIRIGLAQSLAMSTINSMSFCPGVSSGESTNFQRILVDPSNLIEDITDFDERKGRESALLFHMSLRLVEEFIPSADGKRPLLPSSHLSTTSRNDLNHSGHTSDHVYAHANPSALISFVEVHWQTAFKNAIDTNGYVTADILIFNLTSPSYYLFHQIRSSSSGTIMSSFSLMCRAAGAVQADAVIRAKFDTNIHGGLDLTKAVSVKVAYLDGDFNKYLGWDMEDARVIANGYGLFSSANFNREELAARISAAQESATSMQSYFVNPIDHHNDEGEDEEEESIEESLGSYEQELSILTRPLLGDHVTTSDGIGEVVGVHPDGNISVNMPSIQRVRLPTSEASVILDANRTTNHRKEATSAVLKSMLILCTRLESQDSRSILVQRNNTSSLCGMLIQLMKRQHHLPEITMTASHIIDRILGLSGLPAEQHASVRSEINDIVKRDAPPNQHQVNMDNIAAEIVEHQRIVEVDKANVAMAKAKVEDIEHALRSLPPVPVVKVTAKSKRPAPAPAPAQSRHVKAKFEQDNLVSISAGSKSFVAKTTSRRKLDITRLSLRRKSVSPGELQRMIKSGGKEQTTCKLCPLDYAENTTACNKVFEVFDAKEAIPVLKYKNGKSVYLVSPKLRPCCSYLEKAQGDKSTIYAIIM